MKGKRISPAQVVQNLKADMAAGKDVTIAVRERQGNYDAHDTKPGIGQPDAHNTKPKPRGVC